MPSSSDLPRRLPESAMMFGAPASAARGINSLKSSSMAGCRDLSLVPLVSSIAPGTMVGMRPYFFSVGQSLIPMRSKPLIPRLTQCSQACSRLTPRPKTPRVTDCFNRPFRSPAGAALVKKGAANRAAATVGRKWRRVMPICYRTRRGIGPATRQPPDALRTAWVEGGIGMVFGRFWI